MCFCSDFRKHDKISKADANRMPKIDELIERLGLACYISMLALTMEPNAGKTSGEVAPFARNLCLGKRLIVQLDNVPKYRAKLQRNGLKVRR